MNPEFSIHPVVDLDRAWVKQFLNEHWGSSRIVSRGKVHLADQLPGFLAVQNFPGGVFPAGERLGLITFTIEMEECEIVTLDSRLNGVGIGSQLLNTVELTARQAGCERLWLITSNDNTPALRFYQRWGFRLAALHRGAIDATRKLKPEIPMIGIDGIPIHDEFELEKQLR